MNTLVSVRILVKFMYCVTHSISRSYTIKMHESTLNNWKSHMYMYNYLKLSQAWLLRILVHPFSDYWKCIWLHVTEFVLCKWSWFSHGKNFTQDSRQTLNKSGILSSGPRRQDIHFRDNVNLRKVTVSLDLLALWIAFTCSLFFFLCSTWSQIYIICAWFSHPFSLFLIFLWFYPG